jgi:hypothetical protein
MSQPTLSQLVSALQLLMGDMVAANRAFVILEAFPDLIVLAQGAQADNVSTRLRSAEYQIRLADKIVDGSSGLGATAAKNASYHVDKAHAELSEVLHILRVKEYP